MNSSEDTISDEGVEGQMKPVLLWSNPDYVINPAQVGYSHPILARAPYPFDPYFSGILTAYGPQPPVMGMAPTRVPLPLDLAEDGPIYVNAKQYHGILRRRQSRARLEAQNKLVKSRKPYLHESRHLHALNRVRGSGGRFLSKKKNQQSDPNQSTTNHCMPDQDSRKFHEKKVALRSESPHSMFGEHVQATTHSNIMIACDTNSLYHQQTDRRFSGISPHMSGAMQCSGRLLHGGTQHFASIVQ